MVEIKTFKLRQLKGARYNPRIISVDAMAGLSASLKRFGCVEPIVVNIRGGRNTIVGGHQRYKVLKAMHADNPDWRCPCVTVDLKKTDEKLLNITLNNPHIQGEFSEDLAGLIDMLREQMPNEKDYVGLRIDKLRDELGIEEKRGNVPEDDVPGLPKKARTKRGDLYTLGDHKLLCGDCTDDKDVKRLMKAEKARMMMTDPPYCVDYTGNERPGGGKDWTKYYHEIDIPNALVFMKAFLETAIKVLNTKAALYIWYADCKRGVIEAACKAYKILIHQQIIWVKPAIVPGYSFYPWRHEPCLLMWQKGHKPHYRGKLTFRGTVWPVGYVRTGDPTEPEYYTDVWELDWAGKKRNPIRLHPTVKPVEVFAIAMRIHTNVGDLCYEPFCGSGTQLIAAEKLGRRCFAIEIEPVFCDVIVERWEKWVGKRAHLVGGAKRGSLGRVGAGKSTTGDSGRRKRAKKGAKTRNRAKSGKSRA